MSLTGQIEWYNENELRAYPLLETVTQVADNGIKLPTNIIADMHIACPPDLLPVMLYSVHITSNIIGVTICSYSTSKPEGLLAVASGGFAINSILPYRAYSLTAINSRVSGWVVFGDFPKTVVHTPYIFSTPAQSQLADRAVKLINSPPILYLAKEGYTAIQASRLVKLIAGGSATIKAQDLALTDPAGFDGKISIGLKPGATGFAPKCVETGTQQACGVPVILNVGGIYANSDGKIVLRFKSM